MQGHPSENVKQEITEAPNRLDALLALRGFACLMVVVFHSGPVRKAVVYRNIDLSWLWFSSGAVGVWIFFCLSGYLMGKAFYSGRYPITTQGVIHFWKNRALRIFPLYYFSILILSIFVYPDILRLENWGSLVRVLTFTYPAHLKPDVMFNRVFWSLSTEVQFYFIVPFLYAGISRHLHRSKTVFTTLLFIVVAVFSIKSIFLIPIISELKQDAYYIFKYWCAPLVTNLDVFLIGFLVNPLLQESYKKKSTRDLQGKNSYFHSRTKSEIILPIISLIGVVLLYLFTAHHAYSQELFFLPGRSGGFRTATSIFILQPLTAIITAFFIWAFEMKSHLIRSRQISFEAILENPIRLLEIPGYLSYGIYIWHIPIRTQILPLISSNIPFEAFYSGLSMTLFLSIVMATLTYYLVEYPASQFKA
jgi:peptidoglycan/LPS O-acetylase OafA/YrhL